MADDKLRFKIGDKAYTFSMKDITGRDERDFRKQTGFTVASALVAVQNGEILLELAAGLAWLHDRRDNASLEYETVLDSINYDNFDFTDEGEDEADPPTKPDGNDSEK